MFVSLALGALFPATCAGCDGRDGPFCARCRASLAPTTRRTGTLDVASSGAYDGALRRAILRYKGGRRDVGDALAGCLGAFGRDVVALARADAIVPVTTTASRRRERGFDQGVRLARALADASGVPMRSVLRQTAGDAQRGRSRAERLLAAARYACESPAAVAGRRVVLVDDVVTTGATLADCAIVLRRCGAIVERAVVLARA